MLLVYVILIVAPIVAKTFLKDTLKDMSTMQLFQPMGLKNNFTNGDMTGTRIAPGVSPPIKTPINYKLMLRNF